MANTPYQSWAGCPHFGLRELLEESNTKSERVRHALDEINHALDDLGIVDFRVENITRDSYAGAAVGQWTVTLASTADPEKTFSIGLDGKTR